MTTSRERLWPVLIDQVKCAAAVWREPDQGIWEARGEPQHYVSSKLMCWVALDRGARLAERRGHDESAEEWQGIADEVRDDLLEHGVDKRGVFRQHYDTDALDASTLLVPLLRFLPPDDERVVATVCAIARRADRERARDALPHRGDRRRPQRRGGDVPDLLLLARLGAVGDRRAIAKPNTSASGCCRYSSPLGLYAEELEASSGRHLGNYPQAFTHLALINAVTHVIAAQQQSRA